MGGLSGQHWGRITIRISRVDGIGGAGFAYRERMRHITLLYRYEGDLYGDIFGSDIWTRLQTFVDQVSI